jgi:hypothetical protein
MADLANQTPIEIDTVIAKLERQLARAIFGHGATMERLHSAVGDDKERLGRGHYVWKLSTDATLAKADEIIASGHYRRDRVTEVLEQLRAADAEIRGIHVDLDPRHAEFTRRGGWTRAFIVLNTNGHVHKDFHCHTCRPTTAYGWLPQLSGLTEDEIVQAAGSDACTACYPSAPVDRLPARTAFSAEEREEQEAAAATKAEKDARAAAKAAKAIANPDGTPLKFDGWTLPTVVTAQNTYVDRLAYDMACIQAGNTGGLDRAEDFEAVLTALAHKRGTTVEEQREALAPKVLKKAKTYGYKA